MDESDKTEIVCIRAKGSAGGVKVCTSTSGASAAGEDAVAWVVVGADGFCLTI